MALDGKAVMSGFEPNFGCIFCAFWEPYLIVIKIKLLPMNFIDLIPGKKLLCFENCFRPVHVLWSRYYPDFILILSKENLTETWIKLFLQKSEWNLKIVPNFEKIWVKSGSNQDQIRVKSGSNQGLIRVWSLIRFKSGSNQDN